ncbi:hypothetical protein pb186bvf_017269 [Paramecium bursaria]
MNIFTFSFYSGRQVNFLNEIIEFTCCMISLKDFYKGIFFWSYFNKIQNFIEYYICMEYMNFRQIIYTIIFQNWIQIQSKSSHNILNDFNCDICDIGILLKDIIPLRKVIIQIQEAQSAKQSHVDQEIKQYNYGIETFGDLTNTKFTLQFLFNVNASSSTFVASINDGQNWLFKYFFSLTFIIKFNVQYYKHILMLTLNYQTSQWYQIVFTQQCYKSVIFKIAYPLIIIKLFPPLRYLIFQIHLLQIIIQFKLARYRISIGILITFYNTKYPEVVIDMNIQEKIQSNITLDYSDYKYIAKLGDLFDYDQYDPYLMNESLYKIKQHQMISLSFDLEYKHQTNLRRISFIKLHS